MALMATVLLAATAGAADAPIRSRAGLDAHLREHAADSPLNALSPGARERFLYSLRFDERGGLVGASGVDVADELTQPQILAIFELFGPELVPYAPPSLLEEVRGVEKEVRSRDQVGAIERRYINYFKAVTDVREAEADDRRAAMTAAFDAHLAGLYESRAMTRVDDHELRLLRRAAQEVAMDTREPRYLEAFRVVFGERQRRKLLSSGDLHTLYSLLLSAHRIADVRRLANEFRRAGLPRLPAFIDGIGDNTGVATVWRLDAKGPQLTREAVDLGAIQILVTAGSASRDAADDISADALLGPVFARHARWLAQAPGVESVDDARQWNRERPEAPISMIYDRAEWRVLPRWRMPEFYVVRDGKVMDSTDGWERGSRESRERLIAMLARHGLLEPE